MALPSAVRAVSFGSCSMPDRLVSRLALTSNTSTPQAGRLLSEVNDWNCTETTVRLGKYARSDRSRMPPRCTVTLWPVGSVISAVSTPAAAASTPLLWGGEPDRSPQTYSAVRPFEVRDRELARRLAGIVARGLLEQRVLELGHRVVRERLHHDGFSP